MNIIEAVKKSIDGNAIMNIERNEWIICSGGSLRWKSNRQPAVLSPKDIMSNKWICEEDLITISKLQIEEALSLLKFKINDDGDISIEDSTKFFEFICNASHTNKIRLSSSDNES